MHFTLKKAVGISVIPLLGGALAIGAAASPASAQTWQDTALVAFNLVQPTPSTTHGAMVQGVFSNDHHTLTFNAPSGQRFVVPGPGLSNQIPTWDATLTTVNVHQIVLTSGLPNGTGSATLTFTIKSANPAITSTATQTVSLTETGGHLAVSSASSAPNEKVAVSVFNNNATGTVTFIATVSINGVVVQSSPVKFSQSNLPNGLVSGNPLVPGTAFPRIYTGVIYTATDVLGSTFSGTFSLHVIGHVVAPSPPPGNFGNEVNPFGNGFDVYQQHQAVNAIIAGWTATQADPATHFIRLPGTVPGAFRYEYAPKGAGTGLFVADPGYDAAGTGLTHGLVLRGGNNGPWQQFIPQPNGTLRNVATGLIVSPNGTGAQLRGTAAPTPWGGSVYTWTDFSHLPG